jgi:hypothetical protein
MSRHGRPRRCGDNSWGDYGAPGEHTIEHTRFVLLYKGVVCQHLRDMLRRFARQRENNVLSGYMFFVQSRELSTFEDFLRIWGLPLDLFLKQNVKDLLHLAKDHGTVEDVLETTYQHLIAEGYRVPHYSDRLRHMA